MIDIVEPSSIPSPPYSDPESPTKALSLAMRLESECRKLGLVGLSAPQVGIPQNLFVYWSNYPAEPSEFSVLVGCRIFGTGEEFTSLESCATFPGTRFAVKRNSSVEIRAKTVRSDDDGRISFKEEVFKLSGPLAAAVQHECDHMNGISPEQSGHRISLK